MEENLINIINKITQPVVSDKDILFAVSIIDPFSYVPIFTNKTAQSMIETDGSVKNFFENIAKRYSKIIVKLRKKNGNSWKDAENIAHEFNFTIKPKPEQLQMDLPTPITPQIYQKNIGLNGFTQLSIPELLEHHHNSKEIVKISEENKYLKLQNEDLKKQNEQYREKEFQQQHSLDSEKFKAERNDKKWDAILGLLDKAGPVILHKIMGGNAPMPTEELALGNPQIGTKQELINIAIQNSEETVNFLISIYNNLNNKDFVNEINQIIEKNNGNN